MESNGEKNKIHISESTAERIRLGGKGYVGLKMISLHFSGESLTLFYVAHSL
jgi:hypothetical protein